MKKVSVKPKKSIRKSLITGDWPIARVIAEYPDTAITFAEFGFPCVGCALSQFETIEQGAMITHGTEKKYLDRLLEKLNEVARNSSVDN